MRLYGTEGARTLDIAATDTRVEELVPKEETKPKDDKVGKKDDAKDKSKDEAKDKGRMARRKFKKIGRGVFLRRRDRQGEASLRTRIRSSCYLPNTSRLGSPEEPLPLHTGTRG